MVARVYILKDPAAVTREAGFLFVEGMMLKMIFYLLRSSYQLPLALAGWGLWLAVAHPFASAPLYNAMGHWATEHQWGGVFVFLGLFGLAGVVYAEFNPCQNRTIIFRQLGATAVFTGWLFIFGLLAVADWRSTATYIYGFILATSLLNWINLTGWVQIKVGRYDEC